MAQGPATLRPGGAAPGGRVSGSEQAEPQTRARHGYISEVRWRGGEGRQPYANQGEQEAREPNLGDIFEGGDRGPHAGTNLEQMRQVRQKP